MTGLHDIGCIFRLRLNTVFMYCYSWTLARTSVREGKSGQLSGRRRRNQRRPSVIPSEIETIQAPLDVRPFSVNTPRQSIPQTRRNIEHQRHHTCHGGLRDYFIQRMKLEVRLRTSTVRSLSISTRMLNL